MKMRKYMPGVLVLALMGMAVSAFGIAPEELQTIVDGREDITVVDVRRNTEYVQSHIPGAINIQAAVCQSKHVPPIGRAVVYGDGILPDDPAAVRDCLNAKPGIRAEVLDGGFPAWEELNLPGTDEPGLRKSRHHYVSYRELENVVKSTPNVVIVDLRTPEGPTAGAPVKGKNRHPRTDLSSRFPSALKVDLQGIAGGKDGTGRAAGRVLAERKHRTHPLYILIDNGDDGLSEEVALKLRAAGVRRLTILTGGEYALEREGKTGLKTLSR